MKGIRDMISRLKSYIKSIKLNSPFLFPPSAFRLFFFRPSPLNRGYTLIEAATVVAITGAMALVAVPIASEKIEDSKVATALNTTNAIATAMSKFFGDANIFPVAKDSTSFGIGHIKLGKSRDGVDNDGDGTIDEADEIGSDFTVDVLRSGIGKPGDTKIGDSDIALDPELDTTNPNLSADDRTKLTLWKPEAAKISNLNRHLVTDDIGYGNANLTWLGPYVPSIDQDPWGRNYLVYAKALSFDNFKVIQGSGTSLVAQVDDKRVYGWIISAGPDEKLQTPPTSSILKGDDLATLLAIPAINPGTSSQQ